VVEEHAGLCRHGPPSRDEGVNGRAIGRQRGQDLNEGAAGERRMGRLVVELDDAEPAHGRVDQCLSVGEGQNGR